MKIDFHLLSIDSAAEFQTMKQKAWQSLDVSLRQNHVLRLHQADLMTRFYLIAQLHVL